MNDEWHIAVIDFGCVNSRAIWVKFRFSRVEVCVVVVVYEHTLKNRRGFRTT